MTQTEKEREGVMRMKKTFAKLFSLFMSLVALAIAAGATATFDP